MRRIIKTLVLLVLIVLAGFGLNRDVWASVCQSVFKGFFVNIQVMHDAPDTGLSDAFQVGITRVRPKSESALNAFKQFDFYSQSNEDGSPMYIWEKEGAFYHLYKVLPSGEKERVVLYAMKFPGGKKFFYLLKLMKANVRAYNNLKLNKKLKYLAVMGVTFEGTEGTVDFINTVNLESENGIPEVVLYNAKAMMRKFAEQMGFEMEENSEEKGFTDYLIEGEQELINNIPKLYESKEIPDKRQEIVDTIGNFTLPSLPLDYVYLYCIPQGKNVYGSTPVAFIPLKVKVGSEYKYPILIFPSALANFKTLNTALKRELFHAKIWNALANLNVSDPNQKFLHEFLMRANVPAIEMLIYRSMQKNSTSEGNAQLYYSLRKLLFTKINYLLNNPEFQQTQLPWTIDPNLIIPETADPRGISFIHGKGSYYYNKAIMEVVSKFDDILKGHQGPVLEEEENKVVQDLIMAMIYGYTHTAAERNAILKEFLNNYSYRDFLTGLKRDVGWGNRTLDNSTEELINKVKQKGFQYNDLDWLYELTKHNRPLSFLYGTTFGSRLGYLVKSLGIKEIIGISEALKENLDLYLGASNTTKKAVLQMVNEFINKAEALKNSNNSTMSKEEIDELIQDVKNLKSEYEEKFNEYQQEELKYKNKSQDYTLKISQKLNDVKNKCHLSSWTLGEILSRLDSIVSVTNKEACNESIKKVKEAIKEKEEALKDPKKKVEEALAKVKVAEDKLVKKMLENANRINYSSGRMIINFNLNPETRIEKISAREWIIKVFKKYFTDPTGRNEDAYEEFKENLERIPTIHIISR